MKKKLLPSILSFWSICLFSQVGINTDIPNPSSVLDIVSSSKGVLPPRLTALQMNAISNPADGLVLYNTDAQCLFVYKSIPGNWQSLCERVKMQVNLSSTTTQNLTNNVYNTIDYQASALRGDSTPLNYDLTSDVVKISRSGLYIIQSYTSISNTSNTCDISVLQKISVNRGGTEISAAITDDRSQPFLGQNNDYYATTSTGFLNLEAGDEVSVKFFPGSSNNCTIRVATSNLLVIEL